MADEKRTVRMFMAIWAMLFSLGAVWSILGDKFEMHRAMNAWHSPVPDRFFALFTHLADGLVPTALALLLLIVSTWRSFLLMGLSCGLSALVAQALKHGPFSHLDRPSMFREQLGDLSWVAGIDLHSHHSFPSGHATAAFSMCFALAVILARHRLGAGLALFAALLGYARVYLSQHFLQDVATGSAIGTIVAWAVYQMLYRSAWSRAAWLSRRPFRAGLE
ncbi:MAG: phosphatase PAP2 family protein [Flavobacteriales bacterium]|jgi:membrane-associated phospholipid phosphatase|nr:phosphatase PAP2 family protein [Flavobacteriales bacterium]